MSRTVTVSELPPPSTRLRLSFPYDPELIHAVKAVPGREWDKRRQFWTIPGAADTVATLRRALPEAVVMMVPTALKARVRAEIDAANEAKVIRESGDAVVDWRLHTTPYAHQRAGLAFLEKLGSGALLWEMGTGKTATAIAYAEGLGGPVDNLRLIGGKPLVQFHVLVICPNTVKRVWASEITKHAGHDSYAVLDGTLLDRAQKLGLSRYTILNCESLSYPKLAEAIIAHPWGLVIVDESTRFKAHSAARTKALLRLGAKAPRRIILSGTPFTDGVGEDAWSQFEFVQPGTFGSFYAFRDRYLALDYFKKPVGIKPEMRADLRDRLDRRSYRVLKRDVLDLPPLLPPVDRVVELAGPQRKAYDQMRDDLRVQLASGESINAFNILTQLLRLTQITAGLIGEGDTYQWLPDNAKVTELDDLIRDELRAEQVVIYGIYQRELEELSRRYDYDPDGIIYGPTPEKRRAQAIAEFQAGQRQHLFVQTHTGGIGITLTAASTVIFNTRGWSLEDYLQARARPDRIGQTQSMATLHLVAKGTVDEEIAKALSQKQNVADYLTGDKARTLAASVLGD